MEMVNEQMAHSINVSANVDNRTLVVNDEERQRLIEMRRKALEPEASTVTIEPPNPAPAPARELGEG
jgi:hypothetical protein